MSRSIDSLSSQSGTLPKARVMNLKNQLKLYLELRDITAAELSRKTGVSKQVLSQWLAGAEPKKLNQVRLVASALKVSLEHLVFGTGKDIESIKVTELDALLGDGWISGLFEVRFRRVKKSGGDK